MSAIIVQTHAGKPYAVLELPINNKFESTVYTVPACTAWLEDITIKVSGKDGKQVTFAALCKWPSDESKLSDYLEKKKKPTANWVTFENVKILKFCKSVRQAKEEVEKALNVSDLSQSNTVSDKHKSIKRQRFVTKRYSPPLIATSVNRGKRTIVYSTDSDSDFELQAPAVKNLKTNANNKNKTTSLLSHSDSDDTLSDNCTKQTQIGLNERSIMAAISDLRNRIDILHGTVTQIYIALCHPTETLDNSIGVPTLPLTSMEDFRIWEDFILDAEKKLIMIQLFIEYCTEDLKGSIYCIMRKLMTNKVAVNFNLKGTNREGARIEKKKFQSTTSYGLVIEAIPRYKEWVVPRDATLRRHAQERTNKGLHFIYNKEIADSHVANWLKNARKRLENEELRSQKIRQQDEQEEDNENA